MKDETEQVVARFYNDIGWKTTEGVTEDARLWEDLRACAREYVSKCRLRVLNHVPAGGDYLLDLGSGPIQYPEYLAYSRGFQKRYCVDLSEAALDQAREKIGDHGVYLLGSFFDMVLGQDFFDCAISLHVIYHMDKDMQEEAVRKLLHVTKPGKPVIVVYSNPDTLIHNLKAPFRLLRKRMGGEAPAFYFYAHPLGWWRRFEDMADVAVYPWRSFSSADQRRLIPDNRLGKMMLAMLFRLEQRAPRFFARYFQYQMIVLTKKNLLVSL